MKSPARHCIYETYASTKKDIRLNISNQLKIYDAVYNYEIKKCIDLFSWHSYDASAVLLIDKIPHAFSLYCLLDLHWHFTAYT